MNHHLRFGFVAVAMMVMAWVCSATTPVHAEITDGLVAYWNMDENSGTTINDEYGSNDDDGTLRGTTPPQWITGKFGSGLSFNGSTANVSIPNSDDLDIGTNALSMSAWMKFDDLSKTQAIYDSSGDYYVFYIDSGHHELRFKITTSGDEGDVAERPGISLNDLNTTDWFNIVGVYDGSAGTAKIYLDGVLKDAHTNANLTGNVKPDQVAFMGYSGSGDWWSGDLDDLGIWNRAITPAERAHVAGNAIVPEPGTFALLATALAGAGLMFIGRRRKRRQSL